MRTENKADVLLAVVFLCFLIFAYAKYILGTSFVIGLLGAFFESALVGGIADWFAVTALFNKPLGFPYHTRIIPRNRSKIIEAISVSVANIFSIKELSGRIRKIKFTQRIIALLESPGGKQAVVDVVRKLLDKMFTEKKIDAAVQKMAIKCKEAMRLLMAKDNWGCRLSEWVAGSEHIDELINYAAVQFIEHVDEQVLFHVIHSYLLQVKTQKARSGISKLFLWVGEETGSFNIDELAQIMAQDLYARIRSINAGDSALRHVIKRKLIEVIDDMSKSEVVETIDLSHFFHEIAGEVLKGVQNSELLFKQMGYVADYLKNDPELMDNLDSYMQDILIKFIASEHYLITKITSEALNTLEDQRLADIVYEKAGQDLNWIRINGSVVGGIIGVIMYFITYFVK